MLRKVTLAVAAALALAPAYALWPAPQKQSTGHDVLYIDDTVHVTYNGQALPCNYEYSPPAGFKFNSKDIVQSGLSRAFKGIFKQNLVPWKLRPRNSVFEPNAGGNKTWIKSIDIRQTERDSPSVFRPRAGDVDESYSLDVSRDGQVTLQCKSSTGCLYGLESLVQFFFKHSSGKLWYTPHAPISIHDAPQFPHRGLLLDVARMWFPVEDIKRTIDAMSWNKMNRLHLHITDSQSWPLEIPALPRLAEKGAYRKGLSYSPEDVAGIYEYAIHRGVEVIMEIDMPGHIGVVDLAYDDLIVAYNEKPYQWWCAEPPCGAFRMNSTKVYDFLDTLFDDLLPRIAPYSAYFHTGGDELNKNDSALDPGVGTNDSAVIAPLLQRFLNHAHGKVRKAGMTPFVWEEMIIEWNQTLGRDVVIQSWLGNGAVRKLAEAGHQVIDSDYNFWYLDCGRGQWLNFDNGASFQRYYPFNDWCGPTKSWQLIYSHDPAAGLSREAAKRVLGGEVAVWSELIDGSNLDNIVWPRASAAGEVLWSGRQDASGRNRSQYDAAPRLAEFRERMVARGVSAMPVQMIFCTQGNASECAMTIT
ncbi:glycosyl hydrolase family protein [Hirsutella rhossiliensis]|uniref:Beta-hexosaminidase n=1 Tax=Hirsutella rhossiliensis TaxID=111463 RepID=A0A9P8MLH4_9HYPO|nr:glycosyl hydrolase family protein [Hirsutella rhossiliensis]KAH0957325.1 glycosyl hydrolase family protein [Hirsutella rhossiliensis]